MLTRRKIVHIHPTRTCNFKCLHCYSSSGPEKHGSLGADLVLETTGELRRFGYEQVSLSGGEPTLYPQLEHLCKGLRGQDYNVSIITNGWNVRKLQSLIAGGVLHSAAVSFDGLETLHDRIRQREGAFRAAIASVGKLRNSLGRVGAVVSVTHASMLDLTDLVDILLDVGVSSIQLHPVAELGRASEQRGLDLLEIAPEALVRLLIMTDMFAQCWQDIEFSCDAVFGHQLSGSLQQQHLETISPLVINEEGTILPFAYGMNTDYQIGILGELINRPLVDARLLSLLKETARICSKEIATTFYPELVRRSFAPSKRSVGPYRF